MSAVRTSVLLIVFWLLFTAIPCYATTALPLVQPPALSLETISEYNANSQLWNLEPIGNSSQIGNSLEPVYSINASVRNPEITPGKTLEIEIYLSGFGIPEYNKLYINWTAPYVIDTDNPGYFTVHGSPDQSFDKTFSNSMYIILGPDSFKPFDSLPEVAEGIGLNLINTERDKDGNPPLLVNLNTYKGAKSGYYQIRLTFTYGNDTKLKQDYKEIQFHVLSDWDQWQGEITWFGLLIAFIALIIGLAIKIWPRDIWFPRKYVSAVRIIAVIALIIIAAVAIWQLVKWFPR